VGPEAEQGAGAAALRLLPLLVLYIAFSLVATGSLALVKDEPTYIHLATNLTHGHYVDPGTDNPLRSVWFGPGLPLMLAPFVAAGLPDAALRLLSPLLLFGAVFLFTRWLTLYVRPRWALLGAYALGLYFPFWILLAHLHSEIAAVFLVVAAGYLASLSLRTGRALHVIGAGLAAALLALTRPEFGLVLELSLVAGAIWWLARRRDLAPRRLTAVCAVALVACVPWLAYTHSITDQTLKWSLAGGLSLYWMASPYSSDLGDWHAFGDPFARPDRPRHREVFAHLGDLPVPERDVRLQAVARERIKDKPLLYARNVALNFGRLWAGMPYTGKGFQPQKLLFALPDGMLLLAFCLALARLWRARRGLPPEVWPLILFGLAYLALHLTVSTEPSHLAPFVPIAVWAVVVALSTGGVTLIGWQRLQERGRSLR
jgi:4-amino-4-deoxy-L-arabinose transferase-like glycosyltransferase